MGVGNTAKKSQRVFFCVVLRFFCCDSTVPQNMMGKAYARVFSGEGNEGWREKEKLRIWVRNIWN